MYYYLQDPVSKAILLITSDIFLINSLKSGILDCNRFALDATSNSPTVLKIENHFKLSNNNIGIRFTPSGLAEFSLDEYPQIKYKQELIKIRKPAFEILLKASSISRSNNAYGFAYGDEIYIKESLNSVTAINDYARIMGINPEFAKEELAMIVDSIFLDNFRIFAVCNMWKERINRCITAEEISSLLVAIKDTFSLAGLPHV